MYRPCILNVETPPCYKDKKDCEKRHVGCHSSCPEYKKFKAERDQKLHKAFKVNSVYTALYDSSLKGRMKFNKNKRKK